MKIEDKIQAARGLLEANAEGLQRDEKVRGLLDLLRKRILDSARVGRDLGVSALCRQCDEEEGGSCCGAGIENRYSPHLLLLNLLLGVTIPERRLYSDSCFFLAEKGCSLKARHILCINYLCSRIQRSLAPEQLVVLQAVTGEEMETVFFLHEAVKRFTGSGNRDH